MRVHLVPWMQNMLCQELCSRTLSPPLQLLLRAGTLLTSQCKRSIFFSREACFIWQDVFQAAPASFILQRGISTETHLSSAQAFSPPSYDSILEDVCVIFCPEVDNLEILSENVSPTPQHAAATRQEEGDASMKASTQRKDVSVEQLSQLEQQPLQQLDVRSDSPLSWQISKIALKDGNIMANLQDSIGGWRRGEGGGGGDRDPYTDEYVNRPCSRYDPTPTSCFSVDDGTSCYDFGDDESYHYAERAAPSVLFRSLAEFGDFGDDYELFCYTPNSISFSPLCFPDSDGGTPVTKLIAKQMNLLGDKEPPELTACPSSERAEF